MCWFGVSMWGTCQLTRAMMTDALSKSSTTFDVCCGGGAVELEESASIGGQLLRNLVNTAIGEDGGSWRSASM